MIREKRKFSEVSCGKLSLIHKFSKATLIKNKVVFGQSRQIYKKTILKSKIFENLVRNTLELIYDIFYIKRQAEALFQVEYLIIEITYKRVKKGWKKQCDYGIIYIVYLQRKYCRND